MNKNSVLIKGLIVFILTVVLIIPATLIQSLIRERQQRQQEATWEVTGKWGSSQTITGPVLTIPYTEYYYDDQNNVRKEIRYAHFLPENLKTTGEVFPEIRYRSIFEIVVYSSKIHFEGKFDASSLSIQEVPVQNMHFDQAFVSVGISDLRGLEEQIGLAWNDTSSLFDPGLPTQDVMYSGINAKVNVMAPDTAGVPDSYSFSFDLSMKGSQALMFVPVGKITEVTLKSPWKDPSFDGAFLPDERQVNDSGFTAVWKVLHLNRNYPQKWTQANYQLDSSSFGVSLIIPVDNYQKSERSVKYALLIIILTFTLYFFVEFMNRMMVHPLHYGLVGAALVVFYVLLVSLSEYISFSLAYLTAGGLTVLLIALYSYSVLRKIKLALLVASLLLVLHGFIYTLIQLQDYALLMGSVGLFLMLAVIMFYARKIDWYKIGDKPVENK